jgi:hypothetical protein
MCTKEEVQAIVTESEKRQNEKMERSHTAIAGTISDFGAELKETNAKIEALSERVSDNVVNKIICLETWKATHTIEYINMSEKIDEIRAVLSRLNWIIIIAVAGAILSLVIIK